jgi:hypothetical protein
MVNYMRLDDGAQRGSHSRVLRVFCVLSAIMNFALLWLLTTRHSVRNTVQSAPYLYCEHLGPCRTSSAEVPLSAPAEHVVAHRVVKFNRGLADDIPIYERHPSPAVDEAWHKLYSGMGPHRRFARDL